MAGSCFCPPSASGSGWVHHKPELLANHVVITIIFIPHTPQKLITAFPTLAPASGRVLNKQICTTPHPLTRELLLLSYLHRFYIINSPILSQNYSGCSFALVGHVIYMTRLASVIKERMFYIVLCYTDKIKFNMSASKLTWLHCRIFPINQATSLEKLPFPDWYVFFCLPAVFSHGGTRRMCLARDAVLNSGNQRDPAAGNEIQKKVTIKLIPTSVWAGYLRIVWLQANCPPSKRSIDYITPGSPLI